MVTLTIMSAGLVGLAVAPATYAAAPGPDPSCDATFITFPAWYNGLSNKPSGDCVIMSPNDAGGLSAFIWHVVLNILDILIQVVIYVTVAMIIYGGFMLLANGGSPEAVSKGKKTIQHAITGLVIALLAVAIVNVLLGITTPKP
jgi:hypothetical protein